MWHTGRQQCRPVVGGNQASEACRMKIDSKVALEHIRELGRVRRHPSRSLLTTPNPPLGLENPFFSQRTLVFPHIVPVSTTASPLSHHSSFLCLSSECHGLRGIRLVPCLKPGGPGSSCPKARCGHLHRHNSAPGLASQAPCRDN